jgi:hypothetical protein
MSTTGKVVRAERFELVDSAGNVRATLGPNGVSLTVTDAGVPSLSLAHSLTFYDLAGHPRAGIGISTEGGRSIMQLMGPRSTVALVVEEDGTAKVVLQSQHGQKIGLGLTPDGMAALSFFDAASVLRASVMLEAEKEDGRLGLILRNERSQGKPCQPTAPSGDTPRTTKT